MDFLDMFQYGFMQRAMIAGIIVAILCPLIGSFLVLKKYSMIGDTLSHSAFMGVAIGLLWGINPVLSAIIFTIILALFLEKLRTYYRHFAEMTMAIVLTLSIGVAITIISVANLNANVSSFLFGSIVTVTQEDIYIILGLGLLIIIVMAVIFNKLLYITFDEEGARLSGIKVDNINYIFAAVTAVTIAISIRITGMLVISSMIVLPVASAMQIARSFKISIVTAVLVAIFDISVGLVLSYIYNCAPGGAIALTSVGVMLIFIITNNVFKIRA